MTARRTAVQGRRRPRGRGRWGLVGLCAFALLATSSAEPVAEQATGSRLAIQTLLLDAARAGDRLVAVGEWGHIVLSDDDGRTWRQARSVPTRRTLTALSFADARHGWAVGHDAIVLHTRDGGESWVKQFAAPEDEATLLSVWFADARSGLAVGSFGLLLETRDGGESWSRRELAQEGEEEPHLNDVFAGSNGEIFIAAEFGWVYRSRDDGTTWTRSHPDYDGSMWGGVALEEGAVLVFGMRGHAFRSEDGGASWEEVPTGTEHSIQAAARLPSGALVMVGLGGVVATSRDGGLTFDSQYVPDRRGIASVVPGAGSELLLFGERGVRRRSLGGEALADPAIEP